MGSCNVFLFLLLSGYGLTASWITEGKLKHYWVKKLDKIYFPYLFVTLVWIALTAHSVLPLSVIAENIIGIHLNFSLSLDSTMWFLSFLFVWYFMFWVIMKQCMKTYVKISFLFAVGFLFMSMWPVPIQYAAFFQMCRWVALSFPLGVLLNFVLSGCLGLWERSPVVLRRIVVFMLGITLLTLFHVFYLRDGFDDHTYRLTGLLWSLGWILVSLSIPQLQFSHQPPLFLKRVMGLLPYVMYLVENKLIAVGGLVTKNLLIYFVSLIVVSFVISCLITVIQGNSGCVNLDKGLFGINSAGSGTLD